VYTEPDVPKVFIDGRGELYEHGGVFADYVHVAELQPGVLGVLNNYGIRFCMVRSGDPLTVFLTARPNWKQVYSDGVSVIVVRNDSSARRQGFRDQ
jgi:hypothetical protein